MDDFPTNDECEDAIRQFAESLLPHKINLLIWKVWKDYLIYKFSNRNRWSICSFYITKWEVRPWCLSLDNNINLSKIITEFTESIDSLLCRWRSRKDLSGISSAGRAKGGTVGKGAH